LVSLRTRPTPRPPSMANAMSFSCAFKSTSSTNSASRLFPDSSPGVVATVGYIRTGAEGSRHTPHTPVTRTFGWSWGVIMRTPLRQRSRRSRPYSTVPLSGSHRQTPSCEPEMATGRIRP
jgi:hypothetical protein